MTTATTTEKNDKKFPTKPAEVDLSNVRVDRIKAPLVAKALKKAKLPETNVLIDGVKALIAHFYSLQNEELMTCDAEKGGCGADSPGFLESCPFCGAGDEGDAKPADAKPSEAKTEPAKKEPKPKEPKVNGAVKAGNGATAAMVQHKNTVVIERVGYEQPAVTLDEGLARIKKLGAASRGVQWYLGAELRNIYDRKLWEQRLDNQGKALYATWSAFVQAELDITVRYAYQLMDVTKAYSLDDVLKVGFSKLAIALTIPEEHKEEFDKLVKEGVPRAELLAHAKHVVGAKNEKVAAAAKAAGLPAPPPVKRDTGRELKGKRELPTPNKTKAKAAATKATKGEAAAKLAKAARPEGSVAVVFLTRRTTVPLFKRPGKKNDEPQRAKRVADEPWGEVELASGEKLLVHFASDPQGRLKAILEVQSS